MNRSYKKVYKVYNYCHKRWEAALVLRQPRRLRRDSLLKICNGIDSASSKHSPRRKRVQPYSPSGTRKSRPIPLKQLALSHHQTRVMMKRCSPLQRTTLLGKRIGNQTPKDSLQFKLSYDREIYALAKCSELASGGLDSFKKGSKFCVIQSEQHARCHKTSCRGCDATIVSSLPTSNSKIEIQTSCTKYKFPHFLKVSTYHFDFDIAARRLQHNWR